MAFLTVDDRTDSRSVFDEFISFSKENNISLSVARDRKESEELILRLKPDLCIVVGWYWLIIKEILERVENGFIGIHNSLLPKYRGSSPLVWAIINGDEKVGISLFKFSDGIDNGDILFQRSIHISYEEYISNILQKLEDEAIEI